MRILILTSICSVQEQCSEGCKGFIYRARKLNTTTKSEVKFYEIILAISIEHYVEFCGNL